MPSQLGITLHTAPVQQAGPCSTHLGALHPQSDLQSDLQVQARPQSEPQCPQWPRGVVPLSHLAWLWRALFQGGLSQLPPGPFQPGHAAGSSSSRGSSTCTLVGGGAVGKVALPPLHLVPPPPMRPPLGCLDSIVMATDGMTDSLGLAYLPHTPPPTAQAALQAQSPQQPQQPPNLPTRQLSGTSAPTLGRLHGAWRAATTLPIAVTAVTARGDGPAGGGGDGGVQIGASGQGQPGTAASSGVFKGTSEGEVHLGRDASGSTAGGAWAQLLDWSVPLLAVDGVSAAGNVSALMRHSDRPTLESQVRHHACETP